MRLRKLNGVIVNDDEGSAAPEDANQQAGNPAGEHHIRLWNSNTSCDDRPPPICKRKAKGPVWKSCVSCKWAREHDRKNLHSALAEPPEDYTIFKLEMEDNDLDAEYLAWLGDDENEASDSDVGGVEEST